MSTLDGVSAMLMVGAIGAVASFAFALAGRDYARSIIAVLARRPATSRTARRRVRALALGNAALQPNGLRLTVAKGQIEDVGNFEYVKWNSYSRIVAEKTTRNYPMMWGGSPKVQYEQDRPALHEHRRRCRYLHVPLRRQHRRRRFLKDTTSPISPTTSATVDAPR